jgi:catechol 2,3-dioxygenase-like lactoylglutathione lyase family enzyme
MSSYTFDHLHQVTPDPEKASQFYVNIFGAKVLSTSKTSDGRTLISMSLGGAPVSLIGPTTQDQESPTPPKYYGLHHFGIKTDDIDTAVTELKAKGVKFTMEIAEPIPGIRMTFLLGPDNVPIELLQRS